MTRLSPQSAGDRALFAILGSNALVIVFAVWQDWGVLPLLWPYWMQSLIIGFYARRRILALQDYCTDGFRINNRPVDPTPETARKTANFFLLHYGFFHVVYLFFLVGLTGSAGADGTVAITNETTGAVNQVYFGHVHALDVISFAVLGLVFWHTHRQSHREHVQADLAGKPSLGTLMFMPYARILPMHLTLILAAAFSGGGVWIFAVLKTVADVVMHTIEHRSLGTIRNV